MTVKMVLRRCIVFLSLLFCCTHAWRDHNNYGYVDCEHYPFHHTCRGTMSRKRTMPSNSESDCGDTANDIDCIKYKLFADKHRHAPHNSLSDSKLWITLFDNNLDDSIYGTYPSKYDIWHKKRKSSKMENQDDRRIPMMVKSSFLLDLEKANKDY